MQKVCMSKRKLAVCLLFSVFGRVVFGGDILPKTSPLSRSDYKQLLNGCFEGAKETLDGLDPALAIGYAQQLAGASFRRQDVLRAGKYIDFALGLAQDHELLSEQGTLWMMKAHIRLFEYNLKEALDYTEKAVTAFRATNDGEKAREALASKGNILHRMGRYRDAVEVCQQRQELAAAAGDAVENAECAYLIGLLNQQSGKKMSREEMVRTEAGIREALEIFKTYQRPKNMADCHKLLGNYASDRRLLEDSLSQYAAAAVLYDEAGDLVGAGNCEYNSGLILRSSGKFEEARSRFESSLTCFCRAGALSGVGIAMRALGRNYYFENRDVEARLLYGLAQECLHQSDSTKQIAILEYFIGDLESSRDSSVAVMHYEQAISLYQQIGMNHDVENTRKRMMLVMAGEPASREP